jgi:predicted lipid carrier protein YhbT
VRGEGRDPAPASAASVAANGACDLPAQMATPPLAAPVSPALLLGLVLDKLPVGLVQTALDALLLVVRRRHPDSLERMAAWSHRVVRIDPIDLPFVILLRPDAAAPRLTVRRRTDPGEAAATIRGPLETLLALAEGRVDGDTLFFSRQLAVEGDTEVVVALRNAIDGAGIDLIADIGAALGPLGRPFRGLAGVAGLLAGRLRADLATLSTAIIAPALRAGDAQALRIAALEAELTGLRRARSRTAGAP